MDLQKFDSTLKSVLENIEVPYDASTWAALENHLDALPPADAVDKAMRPALERITTPYDAGSWASLAARLDGAARARRIRVIKLAEAAILLLLLLNLKGFLGMVESVTKPAAPPTKEKTTEPIAQLRQSKAKKLISATPDQNANNPINKSLAQQVVTFVQRLATSLTNDTGMELLTPAANAPQPIASNASLLDPINFYGQGGVVQFPVGSMLPPRPAEQVLYAGLPMLIPGIDTRVQVNQGRFYAASFGSLDKNYVREGDFSDKKNGYGGGIAVGYRKGKWGVETGLGYSQKSYKPKRENVEYQNDPFNGISFYHIDHVDAEVFSVPLKATRQIVKLKNTTAHAVAGVTANFATSKNFAYKTVHYPPPIPVGPPTPVVAPSFSEGKGVLENGSLSNNTYATLDLGLRVEHPLGKRYIAFVEPIYRQSLGGGLGPNSARLSTVAFQAGVMASL